MIPPLVPPKVPWIRSTAGIVTVSASMALAVMVACTAIAFALGPSLSRGANIVATATATTTTIADAATATGSAQHATATATTRPATATPSGPHPIAGATIGGTQSAFTARYGSPGVSFAGAPTYQTTVQTDVGGVPVEVELSSESAGADGHQRAALLYISDPTATTWSGFTGDSVVPTFFAPDARHVRDDQDPNLGTLHVYQSAELAVTFPASAFTNSNGGGLEPPGTFTYNCDPPGTDSCTISLGE